jgi:predicted alpha/beta-fold hydrolase
MWSSGEAEKLCRHADQVVKNGNIDPERVAKVTYLHEFDREIQCPTWGYPTEYAYYRDASSADSVTAIRIPTFAIHAEDDPVSNHHLLMITNVG